MAVKRGYSAGAFALELEGKIVGYLSSVEGGVVYGVVLEKPSGTGPTDKSISAVQHDDIVFTCGLPDEKLAAWLEQFLTGQPTTRNGAVVFLDHNYQTHSRLEWTNGLLLSLTLPKLEATGGKEAGYLTIAIRPESVRSIKATGAAMPPQLKGKAKSWTAANFAVSIPGVNCDKVISVEELQVSQTFTTSGRGTTKPGPLQVGDLVVNVAQIGAADFVAWTEDFLVKGNNSNRQEKSATIKYLSADLKTELFSADLQSVGIHRLDPNKQTLNIETQARVTATMYCEQLALAFPTQDVAPVPDPPPAADDENDLRRSLGVRLEKSKVSRRLRETRDERPVRSEADRQRQRGEDLGIAWAERRASLAELQELGAIGDEWSSIALPAGHTLSEVLEASGVFTLQYDGRLELMRDSLVEGLLAGIVKVQSELSDDLTSDLN